MAADANGMANADGTADANGTIDAEGPPTMAADATAADNNGSSSSSDVQEVIGLTTTGERR